MEPAGGLPQHDLDFDRLPVRSPILLDPYFQEYQRLVSNPFLALAALIPWYVAIRRAFLAKHVPMILLLFASLFGIAYLLQFHCLDCGATGSLFRWKRHACDRAIARQLGYARRRWLLGPNPMTQTVLWGITVVVVGFLALIKFQGRR